MKNLDIRLDKVTREVNRHCDRAMEIKGERNKILLELETGMRNSSLANMQLKTLELEAELIRRRFEDLDFELEFLDILNDLNIDLEK